MKAKTPSDDPNWLRASAWLAGQCAPETDGTLAVLGAPLRLGSITPGRTDLAPQAIRKILHKFSTYDVAARVDLDKLAVKDFGDLDLADARLEEAFAPLKQAVSDALEKSDALILLGGDNGITRAGVHGMSPTLDNCALLTFDAHLDLRDLDNGLSNGNPVRALLADGLPGANIIQIGIQSFANSRAYTQVARDAGIKFITVNEIRAREFVDLLEDALDYLETRAEHIYVDVDLDVLDRIYAPATPGSRPGGIAPSDIQFAAMLCGFRPKVRVMDLVEIDPTQDVADVTVMTAATCLLSFAGGVIGRSKPPRKRKPTPYRIVR